MNSFDTLCEVQSDKASVEITSPFDGVVKQLLVQEGEIAKVGAGLCLIEVEQEEGASADASSPSSRADLDASGAPAAEGVQDPAVLPEGELELLERVVQDTGAGTPRKHPLDPTNVASLSSGPTSDHSLATPSVRHFARQHGVDIALLAPGSGRDGRVEKKDVEAFIATGHAREANATNRAVQTEDKDVVVELGRTRYGMWKAMIQVQLGNLVASIASLITSFILLRASRYPDSGTYFAWKSDTSLTSRTDTAPLWISHASMICYRR